MKFNITAPNFPDAVCATLDDKDFFFPNQGKQEAERLPQLRALCASCKHEKECLTFAINEQILDGFWGGQTPKERSRITNPDNIARRGKPLKVRRLFESGKSAIEIAASTLWPLWYIHKTIHRIEKANKQGDSTSVKQIKNSIDGSHL